MRLGGYHPKLEAFITEFERQISEQTGRDWPYMTPEEIWFLEEVWGHVAHFDFTNLKPGFPLEGFPPRDFCTYFCYAARKNRRPIVFEVVDHKTANLKLSAEEYTDFVNRREELESLGYPVVRIIKSDLRYDIMDARDVVLSAISRYKM